MSDGEEREAGWKTEVVIALIYSAVILFFIIFVQKAVSGFFDPFERYIGNILVTVITFFVAMFFSQITKAIINLLVGKHFLSREFVISACIFLVLFSALQSSQLMIWWATAICSVLSTLLTFGKKLFKKKVEDKVKEVRLLEHDLRHESIHEAKDLMKKMRGKL